MIPGMFTSIILVATKILLQPEKITAATQTGSLEICTPRNIQDGRDIIIVSLFKKKSTFDDWFGHNPDSKFHAIRASMSSRILGMGK
jgi:hypothetical protein